ncbi:hypothetical protein K466DRAFT_385603 [Polyporus arcularius HHB13444]|uniref:Uncharacterized protein n=1 Tax=Polyporus arcularius HHB13444 TaxID=1314778 RepID=A0A5C3NU47_9APHY|nr:hypothetical protein K466DRAFT_385603 [Polyporus arcularius HHB13444]
MLQIVPGLHVRIKVDCTERSLRSLMDKMDAARAVSCQQPVCTGGRLDIRRPLSRGLAHTLSLSRVSVPSAHACPSTTCAQAAPLFAPPLFAPPFPPPSVELRLCWWGSLLPALPILSSALSNSSRLLQFHGPRRSGESPSLADVVTQTPRCDTLLMHGHSARSAPYVLPFTCLRLSLAVHSSSLHLLLSITILGHCIVTQLPLADVLTSIHVSRHSASTLARGRRRCWVLILTVVRHLRSRFLSVYAHAMQCNGSTLHMAPHIPSP